MRCAASCATVRPTGTRSRTSPASIAPEDIGDHLYTTGLPDPDLIIRTSGELRLSGFLMWQSAPRRVPLLRRVLARVQAHRLPPAPCATTSDARDASVADADRSRPVPTDRSRPLAPDDTEVTD